MGRGKTVAEAVKKIGVTEQTYYRWKKKYGGPRIDQAKRLKDLEQAQPDVFNHINETAPRPTAAVACGSRQPRRRASPR